MNPSPDSGHSPPETVPLPDYRELPEAEMVRRSLEFSREMARRRSVREFSSRPVPREVLVHCLRAAGTSPSGANLQPWTFGVVQNPDVQREIRRAAEEEEELFYSRRASEEFLEDLAPLGTDARKPFLEVAPALIVIFARRHGIGAEGERKRHYYVTESVGIATGILITALHRAGLVSLTHTPAPMGFLNEILDRPEAERPFLILAVGYPAPGVRVPAIRRKSLEEYTFWV